jgi:hypothetical protein
VGDWAKEEVEDEWAERAWAQSCSLPIERSGVSVGRDHRLRDGCVDSLGTDGRGSVGDGVRDGVVDLER